MIDSEISNVVLTVGPDLKGKGGISSVIHSYSRIFSPFHYVCTTSDKNVFFKLLAALKAFFLITYCVVCRGIKIVHIHGCSGISFRRKSIYIRWCKWLGAKVIFHLHGGRFHLFASEFGEHKIEKVFKECDAVIVLSVQWKDYMERTFGMTSVIVNNIVLPPKIMELAAHEKMNLLFLGVLNEQKGIYDLLEVLSADKEYYSSKIDLIIGGNGDTLKLQETIEQGGLSGFVKYAGWVSGEKKERLLNDCDIYVLPSYNEGLPISILEAMAYRTAILSTTVGGIPEIVKDGVNGYLFKPGDQVNLDSKLRCLVENRGLLSSMKDKSFSLVSPYLSENVGRQLQKLYKKLLSKERG